MSDLGSNSEPIHTNIGMVCMLHTGPLTQCAVDIIFTRCKSPGSRRLPFKTFLSALAAVADESGFSFAAITAALNGLPPSLQQQPTAAAAGAGLPTSRRHSLGSCYAQTRLSISDLTDTRVGPCLADRSSAPAGRQQEAKHALAMSYDSLMGHRRSTSTGAVVGSGASTPSWTMRASAGAAVWGTRAGSPSSERTPASGAVTPVSAGECGAEPATHRQQQPPQQHQLQQQQQHDKEYPEQPLQQDREAAELGVPRQPPYMTQMLSGRDAVQNPLFEGDSEGACLMGRWLSGYMPFIHSWQSHASGSLNIAALVAVRKCRHASLSCVCPDRGIQTLSLLML